MSTATEDGNVACQSDVQAVNFCTLSNIVSPSSSLLSASKDSSSFSLTASSTSSFPTALSASAKSRSTRKNVSNFIDAISSKEQREIDNIVAKFFYGCNISFNTIETQHFRDMIKKLRPSYSKFIPSHKVISTKLLDETYNKCIEEIRQFHSNQNSVLLVDGWKNSSTNSKVIVSMIHNVSGSGRRAFVNAWDLSGEQETADKISDIVLESVDLAKELYNTSIYAVISDNASVMLKMGKNLKHVLWHSTCNSHIGNLLIKDVLDKKVLEHVNSILKEFKNSDFEKAILSKGGKRIKLPCETRWCSQRNACENLLSNLPYMMQIIIEKQPKKVKSAISKLIFDDETIEKIQEMKDMLDPICKLINKCQGPETSLADAAQMWLSFNIEERFLSKMLANFEKRKDMALNEFALSAYFLHPFYDNSLLNNTQLSKINEFLVKYLNGDGLDDLYSFKIKSGFFSVLFTKDIKKPEVFWSTAEIHHPILSELALKLLCLPASSAQIERVFSNWAKIHTPVRNRLTFDRSKKLMHVYFCLNSKQESLITLSSDDDDEEKDNI